MFSQPQRYFLLLSIAHRILYLLHNLSFGFKSFLLSWPMLVRCIRILLPSFFFLLISFHANGENETVLCEEPLEFSDSAESSLIQDLLIVNYWNQRLNERFPVTFNHLLQGGYFSMPSARMGQEGEVGAGYGYTPPYINYNLRFQLVDFLEVSGNYRVFKGVEDPVLTHMGYGDFSDKGANVKLSIFSPEATHYRLPGLAIGLEDFIGTRAFRASYVVLTQVFLDQNFEVSLGFGANRIHKWFGGMLWMPFHRTEWKYFKDLSFVLEYDAIPYKDETIEKHPHGRVKKTAWQMGVKHRLWNSIDLSLAYIRGDKWAFTVSTFYNFGTSKGLIPKIDDKLPYKSPVNYQPLGALRPPDVMLQEFVFAFRCQGFEIAEAWLCDDEGRKVLRLKINNATYREERLVRTRLNALLSSLIPEDIDAIIVTVEVGTLPIQEFHYEALYLRLFRDQEIGRYELDILTPLKEASYPNIYASKLLYKKDLEWWNLEVLPKTHTLFGSASGKFKYALGISANLNGFLQNSIFYTISLGYYFVSYLKKVNDVDHLNPSQIINVRTDIINYYKQRSVTVDEAYLEKVWNWSRGWYTRVSVGIFEPEYGGVSTEWLYYPVNSDWAVGMEYALLKKRAPHGLDFTDKVRKLHGFRPHWVHFLGSQYFLNVYYDWRCTSLEFKVSAGKFLANDYGFRTEVSRYFPSGLRIGFWYTYTNAKDIINNAIYHDKGVFFSVPLDILYTRTSRTRWGYGMSAWLRDVGVTASSGNHLYDMINQERQ